jgi:hypothetical protein
VRPAARLRRARYWHFEATQCCPAAHVVPQLPQFAALVVRSAHTPAQSVVPDGHAQSPFEHTRFPAQLCAQKPQLFLSFWRSTHALPHFASPEPQLAEHAPALHTWPIMQRVPQAPQSLALVWRSTHVLPIIGPMPMPVHAVSPEGQEQAPPEHVPPNGHAVPQAPQLALLVCRSTHVVPIIGPMPPVHAVSPVGQPAVHTPFTQVLAMPQWVPHAPQLRGSVSVSVHWPPQLVSPAPHTHAPLVQVAPVPQAVPQAPQSKGSFSRSTHALLQLVSPLPQLVVQTPDEHTWPVAHAMPQPPQFLGSLSVSVQTPSHLRPML